LGEGTVGVVYRARHLALGIDVAVKVLKERPDDSDPRFRERFRREAQILARLDHPGIVRVLDVGEQDGRPYIVMELVDGLSLDSWLKQRREAVPEATVQRIMLAVASALAVAHAQGIVHRDLKPANLLITRKGTIKIADLGLARDPGGAHLTRERVMPGTPAYMAPECFTPGLEPGPRIDLYALGVIGYQLAFGRLPYDGSISQVVNGHLGGRADWSPPTTCGRDTVAVIRRLMAHAEAERPVDAASATADLRRLLRGDTPLRSGAASTSSDASNLSRFLGDHLGQSSSEHAGRTIVHTTRGERLLVWLILFAVVAVAVYGFVTFSGGSASRAAPAVRSDDPSVPVVPVIPRAAQPAPIPDIPPALTTEPANGSPTPPAPTAVATEPVAAPPLPVSAAPSTSAVPVAPAPPAVPVPTSSPDAPPPATRTRVIASPGADGLPDK